MLEVALEARGRSGVGARRKPHARVAKRLRVSPRDVERLLVALRRTALAQALLPHGILQRGEHLRIRLAREERVVEERRPGLVRERRDLARQRRAQAHVARGHEPDELGVDVAIAHAVRQEIHAGLQERFRVGQIEHVRCDTQVARVRLLDDRAKDLRLHLLGRAEVVVHADLDPVGVEVRRDIEGRTGLMRIGRRDHRPRQEDARASEIRRALRVARAEARLPIAAQTHDRRHAIPRVEAKLPGDVLSGVELRRALQAARVADVPVRVHETGDHRAPAQVDSRRALWHGDVGGRSDRDNPPVLDDENGMGDGRRTSAVDERGASERLDAGGRRRRRWRLRGGAAGKRQAAENEESCR